MAGVFSYYQNLVKVTTEDPAVINALLATMNADDYVASNIVFDADGNAAVLFTKNTATTFVPITAQKVNTMAVDQATVDADVLAEAEDGNVPTGIFTSATGSTFYILYQQLNGGGAP